MTKERLRNYRTLTLEVQTLTDSIERTTARLEGLSSPVITGLPGGGHAADHMGELLDRLETLRIMYCDKLLALTIEQRAIEEAIDSLEPRQRTLCRLRYIRGMSWEKICCEIHLECR